MIALMDSILLNGCEIWAHALNVDCKIKILLLLQRTAALRLALAYRTVATSAILVISGVIPLCLQAIERKRVWETKNVNGETVNYITLKREMQH